MDFLQGRVAREVQSIYERKAKKARGKVL